LSFGRRPGYVLAISTIERCAIMIDVAGANPATTPSLLSVPDFSA
jgi:hypothetical protein